MCINNKYTLKTTVILNISFIIKKFRLRLFYDKYTDISK